MATDLVHAVCWVLQEVLEKRCAPVCADRQHLANFETLCKDETTLSTSISKQGTIPRL